MDDASTETAKPPEQPLRRSRPYLRLLWLIPGLAMLAAGLHAYYRTPEGGEVTAIQLTTKTGMVGQAAEAVANVKPNPDLYLKVFTAAGESKLPVYKNTPVGNGLKWNLPKPQQLRDVQRVEVWDEDLMKD